VTFVPAQTHDRFSQPFTLRAQPSRPAATAEGFHQRDDMVLHRRDSLSAVRNTPRLKTSHHPSRARERSRRRPRGFPSNAKSPPPPPDTRREFTRTARSSPKPSEPPEKPLTTSVPKKSPALLARLAVPQRRPARQDVLHAVCEPSSTPVVWWPKATPASTPKGTQQIRRPATAPQRASQNACAGGDGDHFWRTLAELNSPSTIW